MYIIVASSRLNADIVFVVYKSINRGKFMQVFAVLKSIIYTWYKEGLHDIGQRVLNNNTGRASALVNTSLICTILYIILSFIQ